METYVSGVTDLTDRILSPLIDNSSTETGNEPSGISNCAEVLTLYLGNLRFSTISLAIEVREPFVYALSYVFIFGNFDVLSNLMIEIILDFNLLSNPSLQSSPSPFSNSKGELLNKTLRSSPDRLPLLSGKNKCSIIRLLYRWLISI